MQKLKLIISFAFLAININLKAQVTILDESLMTQQSFNTFTRVSITGGQEWNFSSQYGAICSGFFNSQSNANEDWFVSPSMDLADMGNVQLTFSHARGPGAMINVGVEQGWYKAFATANYTGNPSTTSWVELTGLNQNITDGWQYISSGELMIPDAAKSAQSRIAFRYMSSATQSATWEIKNVKVTGLAQGMESFKITNWNTEWLGCTQFGPTNETQQINNVAAAMLTMNSDVYCIQEVINTASQPSIQTIVTLMGSDQWGGAIVPVTTGDCNQRQGIIYKKSRVQLVNAIELSGGASGQGNSYHYNWTNGRYPALYNVNLIADGTTIPVSLVNIHAKAEGDGASSYTRRKGGSEGLKGILDGPGYNAKNVIIIGDFNDYLVGTTSNSCNCTVSPFKNIMDDTSHYTGITKDIVDNDTNWGTHPIIENIIISNELNDNYVTGSAVQEIGLPGTIPNYYNSTSDHLPVSAMFQFEVLSSSEYAEAVWTVYPNPVKDELNIDGLDLMNDTTTQIYDLTGRQVLHEKLSRASINVSALPAGIYMLKIGGRNAKFVKE